MTIQIGKSFIENQHQFDQAIATYRAQLDDWKKHMRQVEADFLNTKIAAKDKHVSYPSPTANPLVISAVNGYELVDDGPTPAEKLVTQRQKLHQQTTDAMKEATDKVVLPSKMQLHELRAFDIVTQDAQRANEIVNNRNRLIELGKAMVGAKSTPPMEEALKARSPEDNAFMQEQQGRRDKMQSIHRTAIKAFADIEDLTPETVGSYKVPEFT